MTAPVTVLDALQARAALSPERGAYVFLEDGESVTTTLTHGEVYRQALGFAARRPLLMRGAGGAIAAMGVLLFVVH